EWEKMKLHLLVSRSQTLSLSHSPTLSPDSGSRLLLLKPELDGVGDLAVHCHDDVDHTLSNQAARYRADVELIQTNESRRRSRKEDRHTHSAHRHRHLLSHAVVRVAVRILRVSEARPVQHREDLVSRRSEVNQQRQELALSLIELRHSL